MTAPRSMTNALPSDQDPKTSRAISRLRTREYSRREWRRALWEARYIPLPERHVIHTFGPIAGHSFAGTLGGPSLQRNQICLTLRCAQSRKDRVYKPPFLPPFHFSSQPTLLSSLPPPPTSLLYSASSPILHPVSVSPSCISHPLPSSPSPPVFRTPSCQRFFPDVFTPTVSSKKNIASLAVCERARFLLLAC
jgi:hypothetical protein